jgi:hypothetical protein
MLCSTAKYHIPRKNGNGKPSELKCSVGKFRKIFHAFHVEKSKISTK